MSRLVEYIPILQSADTTKHNPLHCAHDPGFITRIGCLFLPLITVCPSSSASLVSISTIPCIFLVISRSFLISASCASWFSLAETCIASAHFTVSSRSFNCAVMSASHASSCWHIGSHQFSKRTRESKSWILRRSRCWMTRLSAGGCGFVRRRKGTPFAEARTGTRRGPEVFA
jgi:hypothetical protein